MAGRMSEHLLVVAPHADDEVLGCGGLIAKRARAGWAVHVVIAAAGGITPRGATELPTVDARQAELRAACDLLDVAQVTVLYPGYDMRMDTVPMLEIVSKLDALLDATPYAEVYLPYASINHDHQVLYRAMLAALRPAAGRKLPRLTAAYEYALIGWQPEPPAGGKLYVAIDELLDIKLSALRCYPSQVRPFPHPCSPEAVRALAHFRGMEIGVSAAELFYVLREIDNGA
jgi:LmbE family N-acetylglucosaminyl deacetylase